MSVRTRAEVLNEWDAIRAKIADGCTNDGPRLWLEGALDDFDIEIERLRSALAAEREECAKVAEDENHRAVRFADGSPLDDISMRAVQREIAAAIRARKG